MARLGRDDGPLHRVHRIVGDREPLAVRARDHHRSVLDHVVHDVVAVAAEPAVHALDAARETRDVAARLARRVSLGGNVPDRDDDRRTALAELRGQRRVRDRICGEVQVGDVRRHR